MVRVLIYFKEFPYLANLSLKFAKIRSFHQSSKRVEINVVGFLKDSKDKLLMSIIKLVDNTCIEGVNDVEDNR